jgi:starvation-inducible outer membrane lipoprotein
MISSHSLQATVLMSLAALLTACASAPTASTPSASDVVGGLQSADAKSQECITASLIGGLLGGMMAEGTNTAKGAAAGAGIGMLGCVALKSNAREAKEAQSKQTPTPPSANGTPAPATL